MDYQVVNQIIKNFESKGNVEVTCFDLNVWNSEDNKKKVEQLIASTYKKDFSNCDYQWIIDSPKITKASFDNLRRKKWDTKQIVTNFDVDYPLEDPEIKKQYAETIKDSDDEKYNQYYKAGAWSRENKSQRVLVISQPIFNENKNAAIAFSSATAVKELSGDFMWFLKKEGKAWVIDCFFSMMVLNLR